MLETLAKSFLKIIGRLRSYKRFFLKNKLRLSDVDTTGQRIIQHTKWIQKFIKSNEYERIKMRLSIDRLSLVERVLDELSLL